MKYKNIKEGRFISRPNRFIAEVEIDGKKEICHVKNTGRCKELLIEGAVVYLEEGDNPSRRTKYDLVAVKKQGILINIDSQAPNKAVYEWVKKENYFKNITLFKPEATYGSSRFDLYLEADGKRIFAEVKGVTLEENGIVMFPDAPTERGVKHINELVCAQKEGFETYIFFVVQMEDCLYFTPNVKTHSEFAAALRAASDNGVNVLAVNCHVTPDSMEIKDFVKTII